MTNLQLRPYQEECLLKIDEHLNKGAHRQVVHLPTASGKTVIFAHLLKQKNARALVLAHTCELLGQARDKIKMICPGLDVGLVNADNKEFDKQIVVSSLQSARQPESLRQLQDQDFQILIYDECHHACSDSARLVLDILDFGNGTKRLLAGFSATPFRNDGRGLGEVFDVVSYQRSVKQLIQDGYLCPPKGIKVATDLDLSRVETDSEDYSATSLAKVMDDAQLNELVVKTYIEKGTGRKGICFGVTIAHAQHLADCFKANGITSEAIHGAMPKAEREHILDQFKKGRISVITNCQILTEGYDCPEIDCVLVARPTQSVGLYQQMVGRGLRLFPNKTDCLVLDFGDKHHTLCNTATLIGDAEMVSHQRQTNAKMVSFAKTLPPKINQKLKSAIIAFNPLGEIFSWQKDENNFYYLKGSGDKVLKIVAGSKDLYDVVFFNNKASRYVATDLSFEYAFATAERFAQENRSHFAVSDLEAEWRSLPISDKQKELFRSYGYRSGIDSLTRGQAAIIISSGVLNKKSRLNTL